MENTCFIIMPPGEPMGYTQGHFNRVYDYVIVPACRAAGYWPTRSDSETFANALDVVKTIIDSTIVLCDVSTNNSNALYGLAVRQALDLPVTLTKDTKTFITFDAQDTGLIEYDESLRIDTVQKAIEVLSEALKKAVDNKKERHTLLVRLGIGLPQSPAFNTPAGNDFASGFSTDQVAQEEEPKIKEPRLPIISPLPDYVGDPFNETEISNLKAGDSLFHLNHGKGKINFVKQDRLASIQFESGPKLLVLAVSDFFRRINK